MNIQKKQYVLSSHPLILEGMIEYPINCAYLYVDKLLQCQKATSADGKDIYLLGHAYCMDKKDKTPVDDIGKTLFNEIENVSHNWTGRWLLIGNRQLITDASCLMSVFYHSDDNGWYISSSLVLISRLSGSPVGGRVNSTGLTWQLLPKTMVDGVNTLFCTEKIEWDDTKIHVKPIGKFKVCNELSTLQKSIAISAMLQNALWNISKYSKKNVKIALTAGKDSRLVLSAALVTGISFESYTAIHPNISRSDEKMPIEFSKRFGFKHQLVKPIKYDRQKEMEFQEFCCKNSLGADMSFYANGQFDGFTGDDIIIRSGIFEAAQHYGRSIMADATLQSLETGFRKYYASDITPKQDEALKEWLAYAEENPIPFIDIRDRFYIEQRVNGWVAAIEQAMDINDFTSIQIANCSELISVLLSATEEERSSLALSFEPIKQMTPELMEYPVNQIVLADTLRIYKNGIKKRLKKILRCK